MSTLSVVLDVFVLIGLGVTIFYCVRLTKSLNTFRSARQDFGSTMRDLSSHIDDAYRAVENLKTVSRDSGQNLQKIINESRVIAHELEILNQSVSQMVPGLDGGDRGDDIPAFSIFDREEPQAAEEDFPDTNFSSQAERDLYDALQKSQRSFRSKSV